MWQKKLESRHVISMYGFVMLKKIIIDFSMHKLLVGTIDCNCNARLYEVLDKSCLSYHALIISNVV